MWRIDRIGSMPFFWVVIMTFVNLTPGQHPRGMHTAEDLAFVREMITAGQEPWKSAWENLLVLADSALKRTPEAMPDFDVPGYYGGGQEEHIRMKNLLSNDATAAYVCALIYQIDVDVDTQKRETCGEKAIEILDDWAAKNEKYSGGDGSLVMAYNGCLMPVVGDLMYNSQVWDSTRRDAFAGWVENVVLKAGKSIYNKGNNWGDWGTYAVVTSACFLDDEQLLEDMVTHLRDRIDHSIAEDGHLPDETKRGKTGMWYTYFALAPMTAASYIVEKNTSAKLFSTETQSGKNLQRALDNFLKYSKNPDDWPYRSSVDGPISGANKWPWNMYEAMAEVFNDEEYESIAAAMGRPYFRNYTGLAWVYPTLFKGTYQTGGSTGIISENSGARQGYWLLQPNTTQLYTISGRKSKGLPKISILSVSGPELW